MNKFLSAIMLTLVIALKSYAAEPYCHPIENMGEGRWPIPESAFTIENVKSKLRKVESLLYETATSVEDIHSLKHNTFVFFEGYILRKRIEELADDPDIKKLAIEEFCTFLAKDAYISH